jgi:hypothetical protein
MLLRDSEIVKLNTQNWTLPCKVNNAIMKYNGANTMEFPVGKFARGANTMVKTIYSRWHT